MNEDTITSKRETKVTLKFVEDRIDAVINDWEDAGDHSAVQAGEYLKIYIKNLALHQNKSEEESEAPLHEPVIDFPDEIEIEEKSYDVCGTGTIESAMRVGFLKGVRWIQELLAEKIKSNQ